MYSLLIEKSELYWNSLVYSHEFSQANNLAVGLQRMIVMEITSYTNTGWRTNSEVAVLRKRIKLIREM